MAGAELRMQRPSSYELLDDRIRRAMVFYSLLGYVGICMSEAIAYIDLLEQELARREAQDVA